MNCRVQSAQLIIKRSFHDDMFIWEALQAPGSTITSSSNLHFPEGNKRLALLGDAVLRMAIVKAASSTAEYRGW